MGNKIGYVDFNYFDLARATEFKALTEKLNIYGEPKSKVDRLRDQPKFKSITETSESPPDPDVFPSELLPYMNQYYTYFKKLSLNEDLIDREWKRRFYDAIAETDSWRRKEIIHEWVMSRIQREIYKEIGWRHEIFRRVAEKSWLNSDNVMNLQSNAGAHRLYKEAVAVEFTNKRIAPKEFSYSASGYEPISRDTKEGTEVLLTQILVKVPDFIRVKAATRAYAANGYKHSSDEATYEGPGIGMAPLPMKKEGGQI
ncbi:MAG: hypothetical protein EOP06_03145 [Proteobacteria bacterium]|nr:MAG: hypothetical protein EOP06_03145 [Pseudomonadota bacterium]